MPARSGWVELPYERWRATCDTLHAYTQVLGKLSAVLAPPEPELQHAALRLTARGWETVPLPAPDGSGSVVGVLDLHDHRLALEHSGGGRRSVAVAPHRRVGEVTRELLGALGELVGAVPFDPRPQEVAWSVPLDQDDEHGTYEPEHVAGYLACATAAAGVLAAFRAPYRGRSTPVNAWWGSFDLAVSLFSGLPADPPSRDFITRNAMDAQEIAVGWWPGDERYPRAAFYSYAHPAPPGYPEGDLEPGAARWEAALGEFVYDWDDARAAPDPHAGALAFLRSAAQRACTLCRWDAGLAASVQGTPLPVA